MLEDIDLMDIIAGIFNIFTGIIFFCFLPLLLVISYFEDMALSHLKNKRYIDERKYK